MEKENNETYIHLNISNYYGNVVACERDGKFYIELDDWSGTSTKEISEEFFRAIEKEFMEVV